jgi:hypothetical protein
MLSIFKFDIGDAVHYLQRCIGLDHGDRAHHYCVISPEGQIQELGVLSNTPVDSASFFSRSRKLVGDRGQRLQGLVEALRRLVAAAR